MDAKVKGASPEVLQALRKFQDEGKIKYLIIYPEEDYVYQSPAQQHQISDSPWAYLFFFFHFFFKRLIRFIRKWG